LPTKLIGVNFHSYGSAAYQNRITPLPPQNYVDDSFKIFAENKVTCVRVTVYWESWELDVNQFREDLNLIADAADKYGIMCIYDNHQWECSSWIGYGIGMPNSIMSSYYIKKTNSGKPNFAIQEDFWNRWWNRQLKDSNNMDAWDAQLEYFRDIVNLLGNRKSTFGFEILNEPEVYNISHYSKVGKYHDYMIRELRKITSKPILFCWVLPRKVIKSDNPVFQALASPTTFDNVIYDGHSYPPSALRMFYFKAIKFLMSKNVPLYIGEFSSGFNNHINLTHIQISKYINMFEKFGTCGWALWRWSYIKDRNIPAFNLTKIIDNRIQPGPLFIHFINALSTVKI
jgi:hypothetical protein